MGPKAGLKHLRAVRPLGPQARDNRFGVKGRMVSACGRLRLSKPRHEPRPQAVPRAESDLDQYGPVVRGVQHGARQPYHEVRIVVQDFELVRVEFGAKTVSRHRQGLKPSWPWLQLADPFGPQAPVVRF